MFLSFLVYELDQEWRLSDEAYEELAEYMIGLSVGVLLRMLLGL